MDNKEKYIIDSISNHRESVDTDALWTALHGSIPEKKKKRGAIWLWFAGFSAIGTILYVALINDISPANQDVFANNKEVESRSVAALPNNKNTLKSSEVLVGEKGVNNDVNVTDSKISENKVVNQIRENRKPKNDQKTMTSLLFSNMKDQDRRLPMKEIVSQSNLKVDNGTSFYDKVGNESNVIHGRPSAGKEKVEHEGLKQKELQLLVYEIGEPSILHTLNPYVDLINVSPLRRWSFFIGVGGALVTRGLTTSDSEYLDIVNRRNSIENVLGAWQVTTGIDYQLTPTISLSFGLDLIQIQERARFSSNYKVEEITEGEVVTIAHNQDGSVTNLTGSVSNLIERSTNEIRNNYYRQFTIPVSVNYNLFENKNYRWSINGGFAYRFHQEYKGYTSLNENQPSSMLNDDPNGMLDTENMISYRFGTHVNKSIGQNLDLIFGITFRNLSDVNSNNAPISQEYRTYTLTIGAQYTL